MQENKIVRAMTLQEQKALKKSRWVMLFILPVLFLFLWVAYFFDSLPMIMRAAAVVIPTAATLIFTQHHFKKLKDLSLNEVIEYKDYVTKKVHFRKTRHNGRSSRTSETRYVIVANKKFHLTERQFANCEEGKIAIIVVAPLSEVILSVTS